MLFIVVGRRRHHHQCNTNIMSSAFNKQTLSYSLRMDGSSNRSYIIFEEIILDPSLPRIRPLGN